METPLTAGEPGAALADRRVQPVRKTVHDLLEAGGTDRLRDLLVTRLRAADTDVVQDGALEQVDVLEDHRHALDHLLGAELADVHPA